MCPSFQATREERHSTRGRANLLRAWISGRFPAGMLPEAEAYAALDLCLACKGCRSECPSGVDMARLKYEFMQAYYRRHPRRLRDYLFGYIGPLAQIGHIFAPLVNPLLANPGMRSLGESFLGLAHQRAFPRMAVRSALARYRPGIQGVKPVEQVLFLMDAFNAYFYPQAGLAALETLEAAGVRPLILPVIGAGRTLISKGFLEPARRHALHLAVALQRLDPSGKLPVVGVEPSEIYTLQDEFLDLLEPVQAARQAGRPAWMIDEFLIRLGGDGCPRFDRLFALNGALPGQGRQVLLHGHCYQKARPPAADGLPVGQAATRALLEAAGYQVQPLNSGCCGMAGAFGYEVEHYALSQAVGEQSLLPAVRAAGQAVLIAASGVSCQAQIEDGSNRQAVHPIQLVCPPGRLDSASGSVK